MEVFLILFLLFLLIAAGCALRWSNEQERKRTWAQAQAERRRVEECGAVVLFFANHFGELARAVIRREEIADLIDAGIAPEHLASEIYERMEEADGLLLGYQSVGDARIPVKLPDQFRDKHLYLVGKSGSGKTNLLRNLIAQDLAAGEGLAVLAPEQEMLTEEILPFIPDHRVKDVIYVNPADPHCPGFNPLALDAGEDRDLKVDENLTIFKRTMPELGARTEELLRQALYALVGRSGATLLDIERLLDRTDSHFREHIINTCGDPALVHFWRDSYPVFPKDAHLPITNRLSRFLRPQVMRNVLCRGESLNFRAAMDEGRVLLFNLSDGLLGEQNSQLLGQLIVSKFQLAVMSRADTPKHHRRRFSLYLDEFQTFTGTSATSYEKILSRARKYALTMILAHQQSGQLPAPLLKEILGNVATSIFFQVSREDATRFARELVTTYNGEIVTIPETELLQLRTGQAWCKIGGSAFRLHTYLADQRPDQRRARQVIAASRANYGLAALPAAPAEVDIGGSQPATGERALVLAPSDHSDILDGLDPANIFSE